MQMFLLAGPGVLISTFCLGAALKLAFPYNWSWKTSLLLGGLLSATDPVAVVALLKELGASKKLSTIIEGESLMNDGTAIVVYQLFYRMVRGWSFNWGAVIKFLTQVSLGAVGLGLAFGIASVLWLGFIFNDTVIEISLTLAVSYVAYFTDHWAFPEDKHVITIQRDYELQLLLEGLKCEILYKLFVSWFSYLAQEGLDVSGVLTVMTGDVLKLLIDFDAWTGSTLLLLELPVKVSKACIIFAAVVKRAIYVMTSLSRYNTECDNNSY
ncbi:Sodium/hydrogen exchanger 7 [Sesamum angolense]|uniref:Sodium/hydrogen exchanger 7 n=1 Tax=Sesamum angolense TaxID=2727404 RepID=A0AAE1WUX0_9LAMI|nr:Sodium/hydrogen exchanger 7 [Sesamum angolense]